MQLLLIALYVYDFGDGWEHTIQINSISEPEPGALYPQLILAEGRTPPEDIGSPSGYELFLEAETVERLNILRSTVAGGRYVAAMALHEHPDWPDRSNGCAGAVRITHRCPEEALTVAIMREATNYTKLQRSTMPKRAWLSCNCRPIDIAT